MRHEFHARGHLNSDEVRSGLSGLSDKHGQSGGWRKRRERLPVDVFRQNRSENGFAWLVISNHCGPPSISHHLAVLDEFKNTFANTTRYRRNLSSVIGKSRTRGRAVDCVRNRRRNADVAEPFDTERMLSSDSSTKMTLMSWTSAFTGT